MVLLGEAPHNIQTSTNLFIMPPYEFRIADALITNFHVPQSSLLMLVAALVGRVRLLSLYEYAKKNRFRFFSFGDGMLLLP
jgi:S-adenosylmethionine:tRNA ribosyltransferase-isomerase